MTATFQEIRKALKADGISGTKPETAEIMMSALAVGLAPTKLASFTGYSLATVRDVLGRAKKAGIIHNRKIRANWLDDEGGSMAFLLDMMVIEGLLKRAP